MCRGLLVFEAVCMFSSPEHVCVISNDSFPSRFPPLSLSSLLYSCVECANFARYFTAVFANARLARLFFQRIILHVKSYIVHVLYPVLLGQRVSRIVAKNQEHLLNCFKRYDFIFTALFITILFPCLFCAS